MLMRNGDVCVDMHAARAYVDEGGWVACTAHRVVHHEDVAVCPNCGLFELKDWLIEQENTPRAGEEATTVDRFAHSTRVRTPVNRRDKRTDAERNLIARIKEQLVGHRSLFAVVPRAPPPRVRFQTPPDLPLPKRPRFDVVDAVSAMRCYVLVEPATRRSHRCGLYTLCVHMRRLYRLLTSAAADRARDALSCDEDDEDAV